MYEPLTLLAMGSPHEPDGQEDDACADYMEALFSGETPDRRAVEQSPAGVLALDPEIDWILPGDLECAVAIDRFDFAMPVRDEGGLLIATSCEVARN